VGRKGNLLHGQDFGIDKEPHRQGHLPGAHLKTQKVTAVDGSRIQKITAPFCAPDPVAPGDPHIGEHGKHASVKLAVLDIVTALPVKLQTGIDVGLQLYPGGEKELAIGDDLHHLDLVSCVGRRHIEKTGILYFQKAQGLIQPILEKPQDTGKKTYDDRPLYRH